MPAALASTVANGHIYPPSGLRYVDDFAGAGGASQGLHEAGLELVQAANHYDKAIETHSANFPDADHLLTDLLLFDPRRRPRADLYWASPECTWHSPAGGRKRKRAMLDMFDDYVPDAAGERSRLTMMTVVAMAEAKRFPIVMVENVVEVADWELFEVWLSAMTALGYEHQILCVSAAHVWSPGNRPAPQWRDRVYFVFYQRGIKFPDVAPRPWAHCPTCAVDVRAVQSWKKPGRRIGKYGPQYVYVCPIPGHPRVEPYVMPALDALDLTDLGDRIGDKPLRNFTDKKTGEKYQSPLARATLRRIRVGALMFGGEPEIVGHSGHTWDAAKPDHRSYGDPNAYHRVWPASDPLMARTSGPGDAFVTAVNHAGAHDGRAFQPADGVFPTRSTKIGEAVVTPFMVQRRDYDGPDASRVSAVDQPMSTRTASDRGIHGLVTQPFLSRQYNSRGEQHHLNTGIGEPVHPITANGGGNHALVTPFLSHQYGEQPGSEYRNSDPTAVPLGTVVAGGGHHNLVTPYGVTLRNHADAFDLGRDAAPTVTAAGRHHGLATPFVSKHHGGLDYARIGHMNKPVTEPLPTMVTQPNVSLVTPTKRPKLSVTPEQIDAVDVSEFRFRMLKWREHASAQRFPRDYVFTGNSSENTLMAGNAVASNVAHYLGLLARVAFGDATADALGLDWLEAA